MWPDGGVRHHGDNHIVIYKYIKSIHCIHCTYTVLYINYISIKLGGILIVDHILSGFFLTWIYAFHIAQPSVLSHCDPMGAVLPVCKLSITYSNTKYLSIDIQTGFCPSEIPLTFLPSFAFICIHINTPLL